MEEMCPAFTMPSCPWKHNSPRPPVSVSDERTRSFLDVSDSTRRILQQGRGRCSSLSVKELSARYLSQAAAAAAHGGPAQPVSAAASQLCPIPARGRGRVRENTSGFTMLEEHSISFPRMTRPPWFLHISFKYST